MIIDKIDTYGVCWTPGNGDMNSWTGSLVFSKTWHGIWSHMEKSSVELT